MQVEMLPPHSLKLAVNNSRTHSEQQVEEIAASIKTFGFTNPILIDEQQTIIAGHGRLSAANLLKLNSVPCITLKGLTETQRRAYVIADNQIALNAGWDLNLLKLEISELEDLDFDIGVLAFDVGFLDGLLSEMDEAEGPENETPNFPTVPCTVEGDVWILGDHRIMCGDSTSVDAVEKLCNGEKAQLIHADPPYGMGKQKDGVAGDNVYREELDRFQMEWWVTFRFFMVDNGAAYIWGNAPDLWRLWYQGGLGASEQMELCNEIVWDKKSIPGMKLDLITQYPEASERCLYFQIGQQFIGNINTEDYWDGWDEIRLYLEEQGNAAGLTPAKCREITGVQMYSHWFSKSQWTFIPENHYQAIAEANPGFFEKPYSELRQIHNMIKIGYGNHMNGILGGMRSYFDNAHDAMRDVWEFSRVIGDERHGHATPKPVDMMERIMRSSLPRKGLCLEPFAGSGSTLIAAEKTGRRCYTMELQPKYVDVTVKRWEKFTGKKAVHADNGITFDELADAREFE